MEIQTIGIEKRMKNHFIAIITVFSSMSLIRLRRIDVSGNQTISIARRFCRVIVALFMCSICNSPFFIASSQAADPHFVDLQNGTMYDTVSKLIWLKDANCFGQYNSWPIAISLSAYFTLSGECGLNDGSIAGDWHLPSFEELQTFYYEGFSGNDLQAVGFIGVQGNAFWSSSATTNFAWVVDFLDTGGLNYYDKTSQYFVWPVRNEQSGPSGFLTMSPSAASFAATVTGLESSPTVVTLKNGAPTSVSVSSISITGADANQFIVSPGGPSPCSSLSPSLAAFTNCTVNVTFKPTSVGTKSASLHVISNSLVTMPDATLSGSTKGSFVDLQDGTMYDPASRLIWLKNANCIGQNNWDIATASAVNLANGQCGLSDGSAVGDWHVPTIDELRTFVDAGYRDEALKAAGFSNVAASYYWSSSPFPNQPDNVWFVLISNGYMSVALKYANLCSWPVRSGQAGSSGSLNIAPSAYNFVTTVTGTQSAPTVFTIRNGDNYTVSVSSISIAGTDSSQFSVTPGGAMPCASLTPTLAPGTSCTVNVTFWPTLAGARSAILHVISNSLITTLDSALTGTGDSRFVDLQNGTMYDTVSKLIWLKNADCFGIENWYDAIASASTLASGQCGLSDDSAGGDWHLPSVDELRIFVDAGFRYNTLNAAGFGVQSNNLYWSGSDAVTANYAWYVFMDNGYVYNVDKAYIGGYAWPVRSGQSGSSGSMSISPATTTFEAVITGTESAPTVFTLNNGGSSTIFVSSILAAGTDANQFSITTGGPIPCSSLTPTLAPGENCTVNVTFNPTSTGEKSASLQVVNNSLITTVDATMNGTAIRFIDLHNGTVLDAVSKLTWLKNANCFGTQNWANAIASANTLVSGQCGIKGSSAAGDWRLPTIDELRIFVDAGYRTDKLNEEGFSNVQGNFFQGGYYWSGSTDARNINNAWKVGMGNSTVGVDPKTTSYHVWPVRSGIFTLTTTKSGSGTGSVNPDSGSIAWTGNTGTANYSSGSVVNLFATPGSASTFNGWTGDCATEPCSVTMYAAKGVTATFNLAPVTMNVTTNASYTSLVTALSNALAGAEIWMLDTQLTGAFILDKNLLLKGGWNNSYQNKSGMPTTLNGSLTISSGDSIADTVVVKGKLAVQGGSLRVNDVTVVP
jgi:uncharacterized protein DUF1566/List-Bact-rpt repeat protein